MGKRKWAKDGFVLSYAVIGVDTMNSMVELNRDTACKDVEYELLTQKVGWRSNVVGDELVSDSDLCFGYVYPVIFHKKGS